MIKLKQTLGKCTMEIIQHTVQTYDRTDELQIVEPHE